MNLIVNTDGAARGNPGPGAYAFIIRSSEGVILHQEAGVLGAVTNNFAEYTAAKKALEYLKSFYSHKTPHQIELRTDSQLMASQLSGVYKMKNEILKGIFREIKLMEEGLGEVRYKYVPRAENFIADKLANQALDNERI